MAESCPFFNVLYLNSISIRSSELIVKLRRLMRNFCMDLRIEKKILKS